ncbi:hypothetical protein JNW90_35025 [Micromonospora sp. STR1s_5]|nr:hypothetical protein [Micromonospora sp. STR1s_5]
MNRFSAPRTPQWSQPLEIGATWHRRRLVEHLAGVEAAAARAGVAIELDDKPTLDQAIQELVRECRLAETALIKADAVNAWTSGARRR